MSPQLGRRTTKPLPGDTRVPPDNGLKKRETYRSQSQTLFRLIHAAFSDFLNLYPYIRFEPS
jgi:hypothetical protein